MNKQENVQNTVETTTETAGEARESFTVQAHESEDLQVQAFERGPLTDLNFGF